MASSPTLLPAGVVPPLAARLIPPARAREPVPRRRLLQRLRSVPPAGVALVHAPAGYGKSTLLAQAAEGDRRRLVWLTLNAGSNDALSLVTELAFAFGEDGAPDADLLDRLSAGSAGVVPLALPRLARLVHETDEPLLVVLDDVQHLTDAVALDALRAIVDHLGPDATLVLAGRTMPDIGAARLRAEGRLVEVTASDLRMTPAEGAELLRSGGARIEGDEGAVAVARTEGWAAALYLTAIVLRERGLQDAEQIGPRGDDLDEYVHREVLAGADPEDVSFLVQTSVLDELDAATCDAVLERTGSAERLLALARSDLFVAPLDRRSGTYEMHGLFRECLLHELRRDSPGLEAGLHARAARWFAGRDPERAIRHALAAGDPQQAADLVIANALRHEAAGQSAVLRRWCSYFTERQQHDHGEIAVTLGWCALDGGDPIGAAHWTAVALGGPPERVLADGVRLGAHALLLEAGIAADGVEQVRRSGAAADAQLPPDHPLRAVSHVLLGGAALMQGDRAEAGDRLREAERRAASTAPAVYTLSLALLAALALDDGDDDGARALLARARNFQRGSGLGEYTSQASVAAARALVLARDGDTAGATEEAGRATRSLALNRHAAPWLSTQARLVLARAAVQLQDLAGARALLDEARPEAWRDKGAVWLQATLAGVTAELEQAVGEGPERVLTTAELRILQYLPTHLSQAEIGNRLYLSRNTVKSHTIAIYRKLGANTRSDAVVRGRELGLIES